MEFATQLERDRETCQSVLTVGQDVLTWSWDNRFSAHLAAIESAKVPKGLGVFEQCFAQCWDSGSLGKAPPHVQRAAKALGGIQKSQFLFTVESPETSPLLFCAWWPWGDGSMVSARIGYFLDHLPEPQRSEIHTQFKGWF